MFETVSPDAYIRRDRFVFYETLPLSIGIHVLVLASLAGSALMKAGFPEQPPRLAFSFRVAELDPPPPPPPPPPPRVAQAAVQQPPAELPLDKIVAPTVIPDTIPVVEPVHIIAAEITPTPPTATAIDEGVIGGVIGGQIGGVVGGAIGGQARGVLGGVLLEDGKVHFAKNTPLPLYVEHQEYPEYPDSARVKGLEDSVTVRYTIDKHGRVREILVLDHAERKMFEEAALSAIKSWRFRPLMVDGEAREVVHDLTIFFRLR